MNIPALVLVAVFVLIAMRRVGGVRMPIWLVMLGGAFVVLATGQIEPLRAARAIDPNVMLYLFGVFVVGQALEQSGYLYHLAHGMFRRAASASALLLLLLLVMGVGSAVLMNDTLAIVGTPLALKLAAEHRMSPKVLLLGLAFSITLGSVMSPIGNPQNLLIATQSGMKTPFFDFLRVLALPTLVNLGITFALLRLFYRDSFGGRALVHVRARPRDPGLARLARWSLRLLVALALLKSVLAWTGAAVPFPLTAIALAAAAPVVLFSPRRWQVIRRIDWHTLVFFAAMFVLMAAVWDSGTLQSMLPPAADLNRPLPLFLAGLLGSQLVSNVPFVALVLPGLVHTQAGTPTLLALAAGSSLAGNVLILGAASNVIIVQNAEKRGERAPGFLEFARIGIPLTVLNAAVYWVFLVLA
jgi:Na+/H+ antiporter NhaD/arsenite permease-like protein